MELSETELGNRSAEMIVYHLNALVVVWRVWEEGNICMYISCMSIYNMDRQVKRRKTSDFMIKKWEAVIETITLKGYG